MAQYGSGDIVLLSCSKLGIMTSSSTVREIRGNETETSRIIKKLTAKDLAESLVDLMERYNNLENKWIAKKECSHCTNKSTSSSSVSVNHTPSPTDSVLMQPQRQQKKKVFVYLISFIKFQYRMYLKIKNKF